jgi:hypothetical protein
MDAKRETVPVKIAGRPVNMLKPTGDQIVGLNMFNSPHMPDGAKINALTNMFLVLLPSDDDRTWFMDQMIQGSYTVKELATTLSAIATFNADDEATETPVKAPAKRVAKKA